MFYMIIVAGTAKELARLVENELDSWKPQGGVAMMAVQKSGDIGLTWTWAQAMVSFVN